MIRKAPLKPFWGRGLRPLDGGLRHPLLCAQPISLLPVLVIGALAFRGGGPFPLQAVLAPPEENLPITIDATPSLRYPVSGIVHMYGPREEESR